MELSSKKEPLQDSHISQNSDFSYSDGIVDDGTEGGSTSPTIVNGININGDQSGLSASAGNELGRKSVDELDGDGDGTNVVQPTKKPSNETKLSKKGTKSEPVSQEKAPLVSGRRANIGRSRNGYETAYSCCSHAYLNNILSGYAGPPSKSPFDVVFRHSSSCCIL